jgi:hypothetical protein
MYVQNLQQNEIFVSSEMKSFLDHFYNAEKISRPCKLYNLCGYKIVKFLVVKISKLAQY